MAVLHLLYQIKDSNKQALHLAHINHGLRGRDSGRDSEFVKDLAGRFGIPFYNKTVNVKRLAQKKCLSLEEAARQVRYEFLEGLAAKHKLDKIVTGHTLNDQAETILMRLLRGAGPSGLSGIPIKRGKIIRPLLEVTRAEILDYLKQNKIKYRTDRTNLKTDYLRNRIRNKLLPQLEREYNPGLVEVLGKTASLLSELDEFVQRKLKAAEQEMLTITEPDTLRLQLKELKRLPPVLQKELVRLAWKKLSKQIYPLDFDQVERALMLAESGRVGQRVDLKENYWVEKGRKSIVFFRQVPRKVNVKIPPKGEVVVPQLNLEIESELLDRSKLPARISVPTEQVAYLDWDKFRAPPLLRSWKKGDRFRPLGMAGTKKISDFFTDLKIPRLQRDLVPVLCSNGEIAWVVGYRISEDFKVTQKSKKVFFLKAGQPKKLIRQALLRKQRKREVVPHEFVKAQRNGEL